MPTLREAAPASWAPWPWSVMSRTSPVFVIGGRRSKVREDTAHLVRTIHRGRGAERGGDAESHDSSRLWGCLLVVSRSMRASGEEAVVRKHTLAQMHCDATTFTRTQGLRSVAPSTEDS